MILTITGQSSKFIKGQSTKDVLFALHTIQNHPILVQCTHIPIVCICTVYAGKIGAHIKNLQFGKKFVQLIHVHMLMAKF